MSKLSDILDEAKSATPVAEKNGTKVYGFDDYLKAVKAELTDPTPDIGTRKVNPDGSIARSRSVVSAVNENTLYGNLGMTKKVQGQGSDELWIVPQEIEYEFVANPQYIPHKVKVFVFKQEVKKDSDHKIYLDRIMMIDGADARSKLVHSYNEDLMKTLLALISEHGQEVSKEESPFD